CDFPRLLEFLTLTGHKAWNSTQCSASLIIQYRARIQALGQEPDQAGNTKGQPNKVNAPKDQIWRLNNENVFLRDKNERLYHKLGELQETMAQMAGSKADLSSKLVFSEEEKLKISKDLIDLQIETNKMREKYEAENFELKNKVSMAMLRHCASAHSSADSQD
uniref:DUF4472 domain-containing protein n=1 Tax=Callorhinchus milii TaxID=7868 RepID=A0A4W3HI88_CALMI